MAGVHASAVIEPGAALAADVEVGAFAFIGRGVTLGPRCKIGPHAVLTGPTELGSDNEVFPFAALGGAPQDVRNSALATRLVIGSHNVFREHVTVHRGTRATETRIGSHNLFMAQSHVGHDVQVGSRCIVANAVQLAGHVTLADHVVFGGLAGIAQYVSVGEGAFVAAGSMVERDVPPFVIVQGDRARVRAVNVVGLERREVPVESVREIVRVFRAVYMSGRVRSEAVAEVTTVDPWAKRLVAALAPQSR